MGICRWHPWVSEDINPRVAVRMRWRKCLGSSYISMNRKSFIKCLRRRQDYNLMRISKIGRLFRQKMMMIKTSIFTETNIFKWQVPRVLLAQSLGIFPSIKICRVHWFTKIIIWSSKIMAMENKSRKSTKLLKLVMRILSLWITKMGL